MGRPKLPVKRDRQLNLRLTRPEMELIEMRADESGLRPVDYGRKVLLGSRVAIPRAGTLGKIERAWLIQIRRIGNNLNQLVRALHSLRQPPPDELAPLLKDIRELIDRAHADGS